MGKKPVQPGRREGNTFIGESAGEPGNDATLEEALESLAQAVVREGLVTSEDGVAFDIVRHQVVIGNQHVKTNRVIATPT